MKKFFLILLALGLMISCEEASTNGGGSGDDDDSNQFDPNNMPKLQIEINSLGSTNYLNYENNALNETVLSSPQTFNFTWDSSNNFYQDSTSSSALYAISLSQYIYIDQIGYIGFSVDQNLWDLEETNFSVKHQSTLSDSVKNAIFYTNIKQDGENLTIPVSDDNILINLTTGYILKNEITDLDSDRTISIHYNDTENTIHIVINKGTEDDPNRFDPNNMPNLYIKMEKAKNDAQYIQLVGKNLVLKTFDSADGNAEKNFSWNSEDNFYEAEAEAEAEDFKLYALGFNSQIYSSQTGYIGFSIDEEIWKNEDKNNNTNHISTLSDSVKNAIFYTVLQKDNKTYNMSITDEDLLVNLTTGYILKNEITDAETGRIISIDYNKEDNRINMHISDK